MDMVSREPPSEKGTHEGGHYDGDGQRSSHARRVQAMRRFSTPQSEQRGRTKGSGVFIKPTVRGTSGRTVNSGPHRFAIRTTKLSGSKANQ